MKNQSEFNLILGTDSSELIYGTSGQDKVFGRDGDDDIRPGRETISSMVAKETI